MNANPTKNIANSRGLGAKPSKPWARRLVKVTLLLTTLCAVLVYVGRWTSTKAGNEPQASEGVNTADSPTVPTAPTAPTENTSDLQGALAQSQDGQVKAVAPRPPAIVPALPEPTPQARQLVSELSALNQVGQPMTNEQVAAWKEKFQRLVEMGPEGVPAVVEFLKQNKDVEFGTAAGEPLGYASARLAMIDALGQIGGPDGITGIRQVLQNAAVPQEIALLAQNLETLAPGQYGQEAVQAARETLALASSGGLEGFDVGPLFEVFQKYGDASVVPDLVQATKQWRYYATMALAQLPDGAGVPSLIQMAQEKSDGAMRALEMLAQVSLQYPEARSALLQQARANAISPYTWPYLVTPLSGDESHFPDLQTGAIPATVDLAQIKISHIEFGNQNFYSAPVAGGLTPEQFKERMALIDELRSVTAEPTALQALEESQAKLSSQLPNSVAASSP